MRSAKFGSSLQKLSIFRSNADTAVSTSATSALKTTVQDSQITAVSSLFRQFCAECHVQTPKLRPASTQSAYRHLSKNVAKSKNESDVHRSVPCSPNSRGFKSRVSIKSVSAQLRLQSNLHNAIGERCQLYVRKRFKLRMHFVSLQISCFGSPG